MILLTDEEAQKVGDTLEHVQTYLLALQWCETHRAIIRFTDSGCYVRVRFSGVARTAVKPTFVEAVQALAIFEA